MRAPRNILEELRNLRRHIQACVLIRIIHTLSNRLLAALAAAAAKLALVVVAADARLGEAAQVWRLRTALRLMGLLWPSTAAAAAALVVVRAAVVALRRLHRAEIPAGLGHLLLHRRRRRVGRVAVDDAKRRVVVLALTLLIVVD